LRLCIYANLPTTLHLQFRPSTSDSIPSAPHPARFLYARPPSLPRAPALQLPHVPAPSLQLPCAPALQLPREGSLRRQGVARLLQQGTSMDLNFSQLDSCSMAAIVCRVLGWAGLPSLNAKSLRVGLFLDFANEFGTLQTTPNAKFICKVPWRCSNHALANFLIKDTLLHKKTHACHINIR